MRSLSLKISAGILMCMAVIACLRPTGAEVSLPVRIALAFASATLGAGIMMGAVLIGSLKSRSDWANRIVAYATGIWAFTSVVLFVSGDLGRYWLQSAMVAGASVAFAIWGAKPAKQKGSSEPQRLPKKR